MTGSCAEEMVDVTAGDAEDVDVDVDVNVPPEPAPLVATLVAPLTMSCHLARRTPAKIMTNEIPRR